MPQISVIIPLFNGADTIQQTLDSVLNQTVADYEIIVVDDGSTDASADLVRQIGDPRIRLLSYENSGAAIARNRGFQKSTGDYIAFLDADDLWTPDKLEAQLNALQAHPNAAVAYSWTKFIDEQGHHVSDGNRTVVRGQSAYEKLLVRDFLDSGSNPLIRRAALMDIGGFNPSLKSCQDWDLYVRLAKKFAFVTVPQYQIFYRIRLGSITSNMKKHEAQSLEFIDQMFTDVPRSLQHLRRKSLAHLYRYLTLRGIEERSSRSQAWQTAQFFWHAIRYDPTLPWQQSRLFLTLTLKICVALLLPPNQSRYVINRLSHRS